MPLYNCSKQLNVHLTRFKYNEEHLKHLVVIFNLVKCLFVISLVKRLFVFNLVKRLFVVNLVVRILLTFLTAAPSQRRPCIDLSLSESKYWRLI